MRNQWILSKKESNDKINSLTKELYSSKKEESLLKEDIRKAEEKIELLQIELRESKEKITLLENDLVESKKESKENIFQLQTELDKCRKESNDIFNDMKKEIEQLKISNSKLNEKIENIEGGYNHMKSLNTQIIFDRFKAKDKNLENKPEAYMDANSLVRILNLMSIDYEEVSNKLREKEKEIEELKKEPEKK